MNYLQARISEVADPEFQTLIDEIYHCVGWRRDDSRLKSVWLLLQAIVAQDPAALNTNRLAVPGLLSTKIERIPEGVVYDLCRDVAELKHTPIEAFDGKTLMALLKAVNQKSAIRSAVPRKRAPSRGEIRHDASTRIIKQRRANGDL